MSSLALLFTIPLELDNGGFYPHHGPHFHRWLPNGRKDAIELPTGDTNAKLTVWLERLGYNQNGFIVFDSRRREVDADLVVQQGVLDGGPLFGMLAIDSLSDDDMDAVVQSRRGDPHYVRLGKRAVRRITPAVTTFLSVLRVNYGQYWLPSLPEWNSEVMSLGQYCSLYLNMSWSLDGGMSIGGEFIPDRRETHYPSQTSDPRLYGRFITRADWDELAAAVQAGYTPTTAGLTLAYAHQSLEEGNLRQALLEGVASLEIGLGEYMRRRVATSHRLRDLLGSFLRARTSLSQWATAILLSIGGIATQDLECVVDAIDLRNKVVHEGLIPAQDSVELVRTLLLTTSLLLDGPRFKLPSRVRDNAVAPPEDWEAGRLVSLTLSDQLVSDDD